MKNMNCLGLKLSSHASQKCDFPSNESRGLLLGLGLGSWSDHNIGMITTAGVQGAAPLGDRQRFDSGFRVRGSAGGRGVNP